MARSRQGSLLDFVGEVEAAVLSDRAQLLEVIRDGLARLVPCDRAVCASWDPQARGTSSSDSELQAFRRASIDLWNCWAERQHPVVVYWANTKDGAAVRFSDLISRRALHRLPLYDYFWRPFGVEHNFGVRIEFARGRGVDLSCTRAHKDFSEDERDLVERLRPYLVRILRRTDGAPFAETLRARFGLSHREAEVLALVTRGKTNLETAATLFIAAGTVRKHLEHVYAKLGVTTRTQAAASAIAACLPGSDQEDGSIEFLREQSEMTSLGSLDPYRLTSRESQILALVASGRRNAEIASELSIAPATVKKHLDHIYAKLRVQRRTEAAVRVVRLGRREPMACSRALSDNGRMNQQLTEGPRPPESVPSPPEHRVNGLIPFVHVEDVERSIAFYYHLGFIVASVYKYRGTPVWAELRSEGAELMVSTDGDSIDPAGQGVLFYLYSNNLAALREQLLADGINVGEILDGTPGPREEMRLTDPDGYVLMIAQVEPPAAG